MPSTYTTALRLVKPATGELNTTWGSTFNAQFSDLIDTAIAGYSSIALSDADKTLTATNGTADESRPMVLNFTGTLTAARNIIVPVTTKLYFIRNSTTGGFDLTVKTTSGTGVSVPASGSIVLACDGTNVVSVVTALAAGATVGGFSVGYLDIPQNSQSADYTLVLTDAGKQIFHPAADTTARQWTIPANASVAYPVGTTITFINQNAGGVITIAITTDTMRLVGTGATGSRSLAANGVATAVKLTSTEWIISGVGLS